MPSDDNHSNLARIADRVLNAPVFASSTTRSTGGAPAKENLLPIFYPSALDGLGVPPRRWCVEGWFPNRSVSLLSGDGGTGKSLLAMQLATSAAMGR